MHELASAINNLVTQGVQTHVTLDGWSFLIAAFLTGFFIACLISRK
jgi:hypothetical protein